MKTYSILLLLMQVLFNTNLNSKTLYGWGYDSQYQIIEGIHTPKFIDGKLKFKMISTSYNHSLGLKSDGTLWAWGDNYFGQLGDGTDTIRLTPVQIGVEKDWTFITCDREVSFGIKKNGTLWSWGENESGVLGHGANGNQKKPKQIGKDTNWKFIACHYSHALAIKSNGTLWAWGSNARGQLGDGYEGSSVPFKVGKDNDWKSVFCGGEHTLGIKQDGSLWAWGYNRYGQLGDGTTINKNIPVQIGNDNNWSSISGGYMSTFGIKADGTIWSWGENTKSQLGDGTSINQTRPVQIGTNTNWTSIVAGEEHTMALANGSESVELFPETIHNISIYPNPTKNMIYLQIDFSDAAQANVKIYDLLGNERISTFSGYLPRGESKFQVNCEMLPNGIYNVVIQMKDKSITKRFVVVR